MVGKSARDDPDKKVSSMGNLAGIFDRFIYTVVVSFFSSFMVSLVVGWDHKTEVTIIVTQIFLAWLFVEDFIRSVFRRMTVLKENIIWYSVLVGILDLISLLLVFLFFQMILSTLSDNWKRGNLNGAESATAVYTILLVTLSIYYIMRDVTADHRQTE